MAKHCIVRKVKDTTGFLGCAHCDKSTATPWRAFDVELEHKLARQSQAAHRRYCRGSACR